jgi:hypothetical protein
MGREVKKTVKVSEMDEFLHGEDVKDGDVIQVAGRPRYVSSDESTLGKAYVEMIVTLPDGRSKTYTPKVKCEQCQKTASPLFFVPTKNPLRRMLNTVKQNLNDGKWVCKECLEKSS